MGVFFTTIIKALMIQAVLVSMVPNGLQADCGRPVDPSINIVFIGDSHTAIGRYPKACLEIIKQSGIFKMVHHKRFGYAGKTAAHLNRDILTGKIPLQAKPDMINLSVILAGTNAYHLRNYQVLAEKVVARGFFVVVLTTPPRLNPKKKAYGLPHGNWAYNQKVRKAFPPLKPCTLQPMQYVDVNSALIDPDKRHVQKAEYTNPIYASGASHLNGKGYKLMGWLVGLEILKIWQRAR